MLHFGIGLGHLCKKDKTMDKKTTIRKIGQAIKNRRVLELFYILNDGTKMYFVVAPVCIKENDGRQYLMSLDCIERAFVFDIARIDSLSEYWTDFTLAKRFNIESFTSKVFREGKHIDGYITMENNDLDALREDLGEIESEIKHIVGSQEDEWVKIPETVDRKKLEELLESRCYCLDMLFRKDSDGLEKFRKINSLLKELSDRLYWKRAKVYRHYLSSGVDKEFDDDFMIEADLKFVYNGKESVAVLGDEKYYGSDFNYMMNVISDFYHGHPLAGASYSKSFRSTDRPEMSDEELELDNRYGWGEMKIWIPELDGIDICNAVNEMRVYNNYSVADLLRMNDFWCEVKAVYQHIRDQNGNRWTSQELSGLKV